MLIDCSSAYGLLSPLCICKMFEIFTAFIYSYAVLVLLETPPIDIFSEKKSSLSSPQPVVLQALPNEKSMAFHLIDLDLISTDLVTV